jgi:DHA1 family inner membrane transport protein
VNIKTEISAHESGVFLLVMLALGIVAPTVFWGLPAIIGQVARQWGFGEANLGIAVLGEVMGMAAGTLLVAFTLASRPVRGTLASAIVLAAAANALMYQVHAFPMYVVLRVAAGIGSGAISGIAMSYLSYTKAPERNIGLLVMGQVLWSMVLLGFILPKIDELWGATGTFVLVALVIAVFLPAAWMFGRNEAFVSLESATNEMVDRRGVWLSLGCLLTLYFGVGVVWTFLEGVGMQAGLSESQVSETLTVANLASIVACIVMPRLGRGSGLRRWALVNIAACTLSAVALALAPSASRFPVAAIVFVVAWTGATTLIFATIPQYDRVGRYAALSPGFLSLGFGIGSAVGGELLETVSTKAALGVAAVFCAISVFLYSALRGAHESPHVGAVESH